MFSSIGVSICCVVLSGRFGSSGGLLSCLRSIALVGGNGLGGPLIAS